jgi:hypothetical protein
MDYNEEWTLADIDNNHDTQMLNEYFSQKSIKERILENKEKYRAEQILKTKMIKENLGQKR